MPRVSLILSPSWSLHIRLPRREPRRARDEAGTRFVITQCKFVLEILKAAQREWVDTIALLHAGSIDTIELARQKAPVSLGASAGYGQ